MITARLQRFSVMLPKRKESIYTRAGLIRKTKAFSGCRGIVEKTRNENGDPILIATFHDITEEKLAEEAAEKEKQQERMMLVGAVSNIYPVIISINLSKDTLKFIYIKPGSWQVLGSRNPIPSCTGNLQDRAPGSSGRI